MKSSFTCISILVIFCAIVQIVYPQCLTENFDDNPMQNVKRSEKSKLYRGQQAFTISLLRAINKATPNENVFFSPYSTYHALLLAYFGSANSTEKELAKALNLTWAENKAKIFQAYRTEKSSRKQRQSDIDFASVDKIFLNEDTPFRDCMRNIFIEELENLNFGEKPEESRMKINQWVETVTKNQIVDFLKKGDVTAETKMILANAAYFKGQWETKFDKENTKMEVFHIESDKTKFVQMMNHKGNYYLALSEELGCHILEMPYKDGHLMRSNISMMVFLPPMVNGRNNLEQVLEKLTPESLATAINDFDSREIKVGFPKFAFEQRLELTPILNEIGINELFTSNANLNGFSEKGNLAVGDAIHVAKIEVDEEGSTAAAATALFSFRSARPLEVTEFKCNHPFLFLIYDHKSHAILFSGIYRSP